MNDKSPQNTHLQSIKTVLNRFLRGKGVDFIPIVLAILGGILIGGIMMAFSGHNPFTAYFALIYGAVGDGYNLAATIGRAMPIIGCGIAATIAFRAGLFNIGGEGQLVLGALGATLVALYFPPGPFSIVAALIASLLFGGFWGFLSGWFQTFFKVPVLISSLLMNYIAVGFVSYMIHFPLIEPGGSRNQTHAFPDATRFAKIIPGTTVHWGILIIIALLIILSFLLYRSVAGYELRMFGANRQFAESGGVNPKRLTHIVMALSGAMAGLAGANQVLGVHYRLIDTSLTLPGYFWTGAMAAILSNNNPLGMALASLFFSMIQTGAAGMERATEIPFELSYVVQAIMILLIAVRGFLKPVPKETL